MSKLIDPVVSRRHHLNFYETPPWMSLVILDRVPLSGTIGEVCNGHSAISSILKQAGFDCWTNDIDPNKSADFHIDATAPLFWHTLPAADWIVTNPPFGEMAAPIVRQSFAHATKGIAMLLPSNFREGCKDRLDFLKLHPPTSFIDLPRYCFRKGSSGEWSTDSKPICLFIWDKLIGHGLTKLDWVSQDEIPLFNRNPDTVPESKTIESAVAQFLIKKSDRANAR